MSSTSFWEAEDLIPIGQTKVSIQAENGLAYSLGQKINFVIPASTGFMMPSETYMRMDVKVQCPGDTNGFMTRLSLDGETGVNVLIKDIRISSGGASNILLEEIQNANVLTALKYDYESNDILKAKRGLTEGTQVRSVSNRGSEGGTDTIMNNCDDNPYFPRDDTARDVTPSDPAVDFANEDFTTVKGLIQLPTGIFQNDRIYPLMMTDGLRIEIILESAPRAVRCLENTLLNSRATANPLFHSLNGSNTAPTAWVAAGPASSLYLQRANGVTNMATCPFVVGDTIGLCDLSTGGRDFGVDARGVVAGIEHETGAAIGDNSNADPDLNGLIRIDFVGDIANGNASAVPALANTAVYSRAVQDSTTYTPTATINNVELIVQQVTMPDGYTSKLMNSLKSGGTMNYDFLSYTNYRYSQGVNDRVVNITLPINNSRCKGVLCIPTDASVYTAKESLDAATTYKVNANPRDCGDLASIRNHSLRSGLVGISDHASEYQFIYNGQLNPNRKVPLSRQSHSGVDAAINQQVFIEQEKALHMCGIDPLSFEKWQENFFIGRAFSLGSGIYDARGRDFSLQVEYLQSTAPQKAKLWNCYVAHIRRIVIRGDGISLEV